MLLFIAVWGLLLCTLTVLQTRKWLTERRESQRWESVLESWSQ